MDEKSTYDRRWIGLAVLCLSLMVIGLDNTILNVALPRLSDDLNASTSQLQWIIDGYTLVFAGLLLTSGSLGDRFGRRSALSTGLVIFLAGSVASAFATSATQLILTRSLMGVGASFVMPATLSLLTNLFTDPRERARAIGVWAGVSGIGIAVGPLVGGWLLEHFFWGSVFLVNVPVVAVALPAGYFLLPNSRATNRPKLDLVGAGLSIVGLMTVVWAIIEAPAKGWTDGSVLTGFAIGFVVIAAFIIWEVRSDHPMLDVRFFHNPRFSAANLAVTLTFFAMFGSMFVLTQFLQFVLGYTPLQAGIRSIPIAFMIMIGGPTSARLAERFGTKKVVTLGLVVLAVGLAVAGTATPELSYLARIFPAQMLLGAGIALAMAPATESIMGSLPPDKAGVGSAMNDTTRQIGGALGVAIVGSIFSSGYAPGVTSRLAALPLSDQAANAARDSIGAAYRVAQAAGGNPSTIDTPAGRAIATAARDSFAHSMGRSMFSAAGIALLGALVALLFLPARAQSTVPSAAAPAERQPDDRATAPAPVLELVPTGLEERAERRDAQPVRS